MRNHQCEYVWKDTDPVIRKKDGRKIVCSVRSDVPLVVPAVLNGIAGGDSQPAPADKTAGGDSLHAPADEIAGGDSSPVLAEKTNKRKSPIKDH